jgi:hypothetical protein
MVDHSGRSKIGVVGSNPTRDMDVFLFFICVVYCRYGVLGQADHRPRSPTYIRSKSL